MRWLVRVVALLWVGLWALMLGLRIWGWRAMEYKMVYFADRPLPWGQRLRFIAGMIVMAAQVMGGFGILLQKRWGRRLVLPMTLLIIVLYCIEVSGWPSAAELVLPATVLGFAWLLVTLSAAEQRR